jgi:hypothetical protein
MLMSETPREPNSLEEVQAFLGKDVEGIEQISFHFTIWDQLEDAGAKKTIMVGGTNRRVTTFAHETNTPKTVVVFSQDDPNFQLIRSGTIEELETRVNEILGESPDYMNAEFSYTGILSGDIS